MKKYYCINCGFEILEAGFEPTVINDGYDKWFKCPICEHELEEC